MVILRTQLFRSITHAELDSILRLKRFVNPPGTSVKYFAEMLAGARRYSSLAEAVFEEGPYFVVETSIPTSLIAFSDRIEADGGIKTVVLRTALLTRLSTPTILPDVRPIIL